MPKPAKKVMKAAVKAKTKASSSKASAKASSSKASAKASTKASAKAKGKALAGKLSKSSLKAVGSETLAERVRRLAEGAETAEEAVAKVAAGLSILDRSKIHGQHVTATQRDPQLQEEKDEAQIWVWKHCSKFVLWFRSGCETRHPYLTWLVHV